MTHSLAREEADRLFSNKERFSTHPEDASDSDNHSETEEKNTSTDPYHSDPGDDEDTLPSMSATTTATYHLPHTSFDANTGPKGVIADAQSFDRAKKHSLRNTLSNFTRASYFSTNPKPEIQTKPRHESDSSEKSASGHDEDENDEFMKRWRQSRLKELSGGPSQKSKRRQSPSKKKWGFFKEVDADGYLDAVEKTSSDTVVVVCIYDPESDDSAAVEDSLTILAQKHATTRFVKLHHEIAEMENVGAPAIIAYQNAAVIATLTDCSAVGLETSLRRNGVLVDTSHY